MIENIKAIIFDWGGVFIDAETKERYPEGRDILEYCRNKGYRLGLAVIASDFEARKKQVEESDLHEFFEIFRIGALTKEQVHDHSFRGKDLIFKEISAHFGLPPEQIVIVDDRTVRGIRYANQHGHPSVWVARGKFAHELPNKETGEPTYTIRLLGELVGLV